MCVCFIINEASILERLGLTPSYLCLQRQSFVRLCIMLAEFQCYFPKETEVLVQVKYNPLCFYLNIVFICNI